MGAKLAWEGTVASVQPRIRLLRSFDQRQHEYLGYVLRLEGSIDGERRSFSIAVGKGAQEKHGFHVGDVLSGNAEPVQDPKRETAEFYRVSGIRVASRSEERSTSDSPPFTGVPPPLQVYRERGHRRLAARTYASKCGACIWGCEMPVEMIIDQWKPENRRYRNETFCYGPKSCALHRPGPTRKVPGRKGMSYEEEDWVDEEETEHRGPDD
jgi:hypothetical protein